MKSKTVEQKFPVVSELLAQVKSLIHQQFDYVMVRGEVTNFSRSSSGHCYFSLSDNKSLISAVIFRGDSSRIPLSKNIKNGDVVNCIAELSLYERRGTIQLIIKKMFALNKEGELQQAFEKTKTKLASLGYFDIDRKKAVPEFPKRVAIISAKGSAALQDFLNIYRRRALSMDLVIVPSLMQGDAAVADLLKALSKISNFNLRNQEKKYDVVVICRGGGSLEDLWSFNDEVLATKVKDFDIPVISAIGHQTDFTILDYVADLRAETPSAAAEILTESQFRVSTEVSGIKKRLILISRDIVSSMRSNIIKYDPRILKEALLRLVLNYKNRLDRMQLLRRPEKYISVYENLMEIDDFLSRIKTAMKIDKKNRENRLSKSKDLLEAYNPYNVLGRGYSIIKTKNNELITTSDQYNKMKSSQLFSITFKDGEVDAKKI